MGFSAQQHSTGFRTTFACLAACFVHFAPEAGCGRSVAEAPNLTRLRTHMDALMAVPKYARFFAYFRDPWVYNDAETAADLMRQAWIHAIGG